MSHSRTLAGWAAAVALVSVFGGLAGCRGSAEQSPARLAASAHASPRGEQPQTVAGSAEAPAPGQQHPGRTASASTGPAGANPFTTEIWGDNRVPFTAPVPERYVGSTLVAHTTGDAGDRVTVSVPRGWVFVDETIPSDHNDWLYYDPANPAARFEFSGSGCAGCLHPDADNSRPATPTAVLPPGTTRSVLIDHGVASAFTEHLADSYAVNGVVRVYGTLAAPAGYAVYRVALPASDTALARRILNSLRVSRGQ